MQCIANVIFSSLFRGREFVAVLARCGVFLKSDGVKLKVWVEDRDLQFLQEAVDGLVLPLRRTPSRSASLASWTNITMRGQRPSDKTRSVNVLFSAKFVSCVCCASLRNYFTL